MVACSGANRGIAVKTPRGGDRRRRRLGVGADATGYVVARRMATVSCQGFTGKSARWFIEKVSASKRARSWRRSIRCDADAQRDLSNSQLSAARSQPRVLEARLREAESNANRLASMGRQQLVSKSQYEQAVAQRDSLRAELATARNNAQVAADSLRIAENGLDNTVVRAPFAGVVTAKAAQPGEIVSPLSAGGGFTRTGIGTIVDMDSLEVEVDVGEAFIGRVQPKMPVEAVLNAYPDWKIPAEVIAIIPAADRGKATVKVRIALKQRDPRIVPDMGVRVAFLETRKPDAPKQAPGVLVPDAAIVERDGAQVAFVVTGDKASCASSLFGPRLATIEKSCRRVRRRQRGAGSAGSSSRTARACALASVEEQDSNEGDSE